MVTRLTVRLALVLDATRRRWQQLAADPQRGSVPDETAMIALMVVLAVTVVGIISALCLAAAHAVSF